MIRQLFKMVWNERRLNLWILIEMILVFCVLWFCVEFLYLAHKRYVEPLPFNVENTYRLSFSINEERMQKMESELEMERLEILAACCDTIADRFGDHPMVAASGISSWIYPYNYCANMYGAIVEFSDRSPEDTVRISTFTAAVNDGFFEVFRMEPIYGFVSVGESQNGQTAVIGLGEEGDFGGYEADKVETIYWHVEGRPLTITGVMPAYKRSEWENYRDMLYAPLSWLDKTQCTDHCFAFSLRTHEDAPSDFADLYSRDMEGRLAVGPLFLNSIRAYSDLRDMYMDEDGVSTQIKGAIVVGIFLLLNILLGILGTFWFRTNTRRKDIGLRKAVGAPSGSIVRTTLGESLLIVTVASIIGTVLAINLSVMDVIDTLGLPNTYDLSFSPSPRYWIVDFLITYGLLILFTIIAVWYPARRASKIAASESLREE